MGGFAAANGVWFLAAAMVVAAMVGVAAGQQSVPQCAQKLVPCANYLGSSKPPESCCGPMKDAVKNELPCLCSLFNTPELLKAFNINVTQALELPKNCGIRSDQSICKSTSNSTSPGKAASAPSSTSTPASPSSQIAKPAGSAAAQLSWVGFSGLVGFLCLWLTTILA